MIPVVLVVGFLGAGKTSLLNHLLKSARGTRIGVIVNDFGAIGVDAMSIAGRVDSTISFSNGCLCCAVDTYYIDETLAKLADPALRMDVIVIEASGLADPQTMVRDLLASKVDNVRYGGLVTVVDAVEFARTAADHPDLARQLRIADLIVLNKTDRADTDLADLTATIRTFNDAAPVIPTVHAALDPALLFETAPDLPTARQLSFEDLEEDHRDHAHAVYETICFTSDLPMLPAALMDFLDNRPAGLYRVKGVVNFEMPGHTDRFTLQTVGNYLRFHRSPWPSDTFPRTEVELIGRDFDKDEVYSRLFAAIRPDGSEVDPGDMLWVTRYVSEHPA